MSFNDAYNPIHDHEASRQYAFDELIGFHFSEQLSALAKDTILLTS